MGMAERLSPKLLLALDLGTTTLAGRLVDASGEVRAEARRDNPQRRLGADILTRMQRASEGAALQLQELLLEGITSLTADLLSQADCSAGSVAAAAAAGNPGISYLLRNLSVHSILFPPHRVRQNSLTSLPVKHVDIGVGVPLQLFPLVSGFVGGDLVAFLYGLDKLRDGSLCIDIGTNAELALWTGGRWLVSSAAAGPAFEAGNILCGMSAGPGAVVDVRLDEDRLQLQVLGGGAPKGLCGSGLTALIGALIEGGLIDPDGTILTADKVDSNLCRYLDGEGNIRFYRDAATELRLTQSDLRNFQLAKGALRAGLEVLLERGGLSADRISTLFISGALGTALPAEHLKKVALLPAGMVDKTFFVDNAVLAGLVRYLTVPESAEQLQDLMTLIQPFPLSGTPAFEHSFLSSLGFK